MKDKYYDENTNAVEVIQSENLRKRKFSKCIKQFQFVRLEKAWALINEQIFTIIIQVLL